MKKLCEKQHEMYTRNREIREKIDRCEICKLRVKRTLCRDHDHATQKQRGRLCNHCNSVLGFARDSIVVLRRAIRYLQKHRAGL